MPQLIRTTLNLEQFECDKCGRMVYIDGIDLEAMRDEKGKIIIPDCPFDCWSETKHRRTLIVNVERVIEFTPKLCAECKKMFIPTAENKILCKECINKDLYSETTYIDKIEGR